MSEYARRKPGGSSLPPPDYRLRHRLSQNRPQPLRRHAARVGEIDLVVLAFECASGLRREVAHLADALVLLRVRPDVEDLHALTLCELRKLHLTHQDVLAATHQRIDRCPAF